MAPAELKINKLESKSAKANTLASCSALLLVDSVPSVSIKNINDPSLF
jgi:hypothetical protein